MAEVRPDSIRFIGRRWDEKKLTIRKSENKEELAVIFAVVETINGLPVIAQVLNTISEVMMEKIERIILKRNEYAVIDYVRQLDFSDLDDIPQGR